MKGDPYNVLGVDRNASDSEIKKKYYQVRLKVHCQSVHTISYVNLSWRRNIIQIYAKKKMPKTSFWKFNRHMK
jgi:preprotein translocase subunit Sec63